MKCFLCSFFPRPLVVILWASTDANMMIFYINIYHHALLITKTCNFRLRDSVIESQTLRLTPCRNVTSQKETVSHTVGTDGMLSIVTKLMHLRKEVVRGCMNHKHKHCYNKCMTVLVYLLFYISQNCHCAKTQKISQCPPLSLMLLTRLSPEIQRRSGRFTKRDFCGRNTFIYPHGDCDFIYVTIVRHFYHIGHHVGIITN